MARLDGADAGNPTLRRDGTNLSECREAVLPSRRLLSRAIHGMGAWFILAKPAFAPRPRAVSLLNSAGESTSATACPALRMVTGSFAALLQSS